jgi:glycosyltransferase involved in cell wall biosynthesis
LPSSRAYQALTLAHNNTSRYAKINLLFSDEAPPDQINRPRSFISYIGTIAEDHAFKEFVHLMHESISEGTISGYSFLIATRSRIPEEMSSIIESGVLSGRLVVQSGTPMTNEQINGFYAQSHLVWNAYKRSMQSGVLPKAYMFGTPVLMSVANQNEYFEDGVHGVLISDRYAFDEFENAVLRLESSWPAISRNCRNYYLQNFDYRALSSKFMQFVLGKT